MYKMICTYPSLKYEYSHLPQKVNIKSSLYKYTLLEIVNYSSKAIIIKQIKNKEKETEMNHKQFLYKTMKGEGNKK